MRWRAKSWMKDRISDFHGTYIINDFSQDYSAVLPLGKPLWLEVGTGRGRFICAMAERNPDILFLGIEKVTGVLYRAVEKAEAMQLNNVRFINRDVYDVFNWLGPASVSRLFLNFSDPWPKKRHEKKRLTHPALLGRYADLLKKGGELVFKTDNELLFKWSVEQFSGSGMTLNFVTDDWHNDAARAETNDAMTEYEQRFSERGQKIFRAVAVFTDVKCENLAEL